MSTRDTDRSLASYASHKWPCGYTMRGSDCDCGLESVLAQHGDQVEHLQRELVKLMRQPRVTDWVVEQELLEIPVDNVRRLIEATGNKSFTVVIEQDRYEYRINGVLKEHDVRVVR